MINVDDLKLLPYGESDYMKIRNENKYYVDKTHFIKTIERKGSFLFFIRPRRFGKSLLLSTLSCYYDILKKNDFNHLFEETYIHKTPTPNRHSYLILKFDFSTINSEPDKIEESFNLNVRNTIDDFIQKYKEFLIDNFEEFKQKIQVAKTASDMLDTLTKQFKNLGNPIYVIIDEYDNFANTLVSSYGENLYKSMTQGEGFFRAFFHVLKGATNGEPAPVARIFITGVSPITLTEITSSFNIARNISLDHDINEMVGFTNQETETMLNYYSQSGLIPPATQENMAIMKEWYNGYRFSQKTQIELFNSTQILYYINHYLLNSEPPTELIDQNLRIDYHKLRYLIIIGQKENSALNGNFSKLKEIIENGAIDSKLVGGFPLHELTNTENFVSLLFYFGLLTISGTNPNDTLKLSIPNETVKRLYYDYFKDIYRETNVFSIDMDKYMKLISGLAFERQWQPLFSFLTEKMANSMGLRDLISGEKAIQAFLNVYLGLTNLYIIHTEKELNKGYADLIMEPFLALFPAIRYSYIIEIKYIPRNQGVSKKERASQAEVKRLRQEAEEQLKKYGMDEKFHKTIGKTTLVKLVFIFKGHNMEYMGEC